jgi:hypothetical protein
MQLLPARVLDAQPLAASSGILVPMAAPCHRRVAFRDGSGNGNRPFHLAPDASLARTLLVLIVIFAVALHHDPWAGLR